MKILLAKRSRGPSAAGLGGLHLPMLRRRCAMPHPQPDDRRSAGVRWGLGPTGLRRAGGSSVSDDVRGVGTTNLTCRATAIDGHDRNLPTTDSAGAGMVWVPAATFLHGLRRALPRGGPRAVVASTASGSTAAGHQRRVRGVRRRHRLRDGGRAAARPGRLPGRAGREPGAGVAGVHRPRRPGRPAPPAPVVALEAGRVLAPSGGAAAPGSTAASDHPVVHVAYEDADAYAAWAGKRRCRPRPSGSAPRAGGLDGAELHLGRRAAPGGERDGELLARRLPVANPRRTATGTAPVGSFPPNGYGLHDMAGNVWEWTERLVRRRHPEEADKPCCVPRNPRRRRAAAARPRPAAVPRSPRKVIKGGSFLCADSYCLRYRPAARRPQMIDTGMSHVGFRCVVRPDPPAA